jgi:hypothetical protein
MITNTPHRVSRTTAAAVIMIVTAFFLTACGGPSDKDLENTAVAYWQAIDRGDNAKRCDLSIDGQGDKRKRCMTAESLPAANADAQPPTPERVVDWGDGGKAVVLTAHLKANSTPQPAVIGLTQVGDRWLVAKWGWIKGDPNKDDAVTGALS